MRSLFKLSFILAPILLIAAFLFSGVVPSDGLRTVCIVLGTAFLLLALIGKVMDARSGDKEDKK